MGRSFEVMSLDRDRRVFGSRLPPGVGDSDCDGGPIPPDIDESRLWRICGPVEQEQLTSEFIESHFELFRDAILAAEDPPAIAESSDARRDSLFGLWPAWLCFRDHALREMRQTGELRRR